MEEISYGYIHCTDEQFPCIILINHVMLDYLQTKKADSVWNNFYKNNIYYMFPMDEREIFRQQLAASQSSGQALCCYHHVLNVAEELLCFIMLIKYKTEKDHAPYYSIIFIKISENQIPVHECRQPGSEQIVPSYETPLFSKGIFARCFGHFDLFIDGKPVYFTNDKEKELLALLIDRRGGLITSKTAIGYLWPDQESDTNLKTRYRKTAMNLKITLEHYGISRILNSNHGARSINVDEITCDYYELLKNNEYYRKTFHNAYMTDYSWAEETLASLWEYS